MSDKKYFITTILKHYKNISEFLPDTFLNKCWEYVLNPITMDFKIAKSILLLCDATTLLTCIDILKTTTVRYKVELIFKKKFIKKLIFVC